MEKSSQASDKQARELEEERLKLEEALRDSLEQAETTQRQDLMKALQQSSAQSAAVTETDEDEFF